MSLGSGVTPASQVGVDNYPRAYTLGERHAVAKYVRAMKRYIRGETYQDGTIYHQFASINDECLRRHVLRHFSYGDKHIWRQCADHASDLLGIDHLWRKEQVTKMTAELRKNFLATYLTFIEEIFDLKALKKDKGVYLTELSNMILYEHE